MSRPVVVTVGALVSGSATKVGLSQTPTAAGALVLNGAAGAFTANNIAASQSVSGASAVVLNGTLAQGTPAIAYPNGIGPIYITSAGNDSGITFAVVGRDVNGATKTETMTGTNASVVGSVNSYYEIVSITTSGSTASTITVGTFGVATLDKARRIIFTSGGTDTGITIAVAGTNWEGAPISETVTGGSSGSPASTVLDYLTVSSAKVSGATASTIEIGTNGIAASPWVAFDAYYLPQADIQCTVVGTVNYTVQMTQDDPNSPTNPVTPALMTWLSTSDPNAVGATASLMTSFAYSPAWARVLLNSGSGSVTATFTQLGFRP